MGEGFGRNGTGGRSSAGWKSWLGAWLTATTIGTWLFTVTYFIAAGDLLAGWAAMLPLSVLPLIVLPFLVVVFVVPMTLVAAGLRGLWLHAAPSSWRAAAVPAVVAGSLSGPLGQLLLDLMLWATAATGSDLAGRMLRSWWLDTLSFAPPLILGGATAGYVAHRCLWPNSRRWWVLLAATCVAGVLLLSPTDPTLPFGPERPGPWGSELPLGDGPPRGSPAGAGSAGALPSLPRSTHRSRRVGSTAKGRGPSPRTSSAAAFSWPGRTVVTETSDSSPREANATHGVPSPHPRHPALRTARAGRRDDPERKRSCCEPSLS